MAETLKPCPFYGCEAHIREVVSACSVVYTVGCPDSECMGFETLLCKPTPEEAVAAWNLRAERTCRKVPGRMKYGRRTPKCSECGQSLGDERWSYCPRCGARVVGE